MQPRCVFVQSVIISLNWRIVEFLPITTLTLFSNFNWSSLIFINRLLGNTGNRAGTTSWKTETLSFSNSTHPMLLKRNHETTKSPEEELRIQFSWAPMSYTVCWFSYFSLEFRGSTLVGHRYILIRPSRSGPESIKMIPYNNVSIQE